MDGAPSSPRVSFIIAARNAERYITDCIDSLLEQTFNDVEVIVCDDGSSDGTLRAIEKYSNDARVTVLVNDFPMRAAHARNRCLSIASGEFVAIQDADDLSRSERVARQIAFLEAHPKLAMVGVQAAFFDESGFWGRTEKPVDPSKADLLFSLPFVHASLMFRRDALCAVHGYRVARETRRNEDYDLVLRLYANGFKGRNIPEVLYEYRVDKAAIQRRKYRFRVDEAIVRAKGFYKGGYGLRSIPYVIKPLLVGLLPPAIVIRVRRLRGARIGL